MEEVGHKEDAVGALEDGGGGEFVGEELEEGVEGKGLYACRGVKGFGVNDLECLFECVLIAWVAVGVGDGEELVGLVDECEVDAPGIDA